MKKFKINNKFKHGGYIASLIVIMLVIVVVVNLIVSQLNLKIDLTSNKIFSISEETNRFLKNINKDIKVIGLYEVENQDNTAKEILDKYAAKCKKISVQYIDPVKHPELSAKYSKNGEALAKGSIIVESGSKYKIINNSDMYSISQNSGTVEIEKQITGAIMFVISENNPTLYTLQGHNEQVLSKEIVKSLGTNNYTIKDVNLLTEQWNIKKGDVLVVNSPKRDITADEVKKIKAFMENGGRALMLIDYIKEDMENFNQFLNGYGVRLNKSLIYEDNLSNRIGNNKLYLIPNLSNNPIVKPLKDSKIPVLIPAAQPIEIMMVKRDTLYIDPLLTTSNKSFAKNGFNSQSTEKLKGDANGPFNVAVAITDRVDSKNEFNNGKMIVISSSLLLDPQLIKSSGGGNEDIITNSFNWLSERKENVSIAPKDLSTAVLNINGTNQLVIAGISIILIPILIGGVGVFVWLRRRNL